MKVAASKPSNGVKNTPRSIKGCFRLTEAAQLSKKTASDRAPREIAA